MMKAGTSTYTQCGLMSLGKRVDRPSWKYPETIGKEKLGMGKPSIPLTDWSESFKEKII